MLQQAVLRLVTLNCLWRGDARARLRAIAADLERRDADVVCLQEVVWRRNARLVRELTPSYPFIAYRPMAPFGVMGGLVTLARHPIVSQEFTSTAREAALLRVRWPIGCCVRGGSPRPFSSQLSRST